MTQRGEPSELCRTSLGPAKIDDTSCVSVHGVEAGREVGDRGREMDKDTSVTSAVGRAFAGRAGAVQALGAWAGLLALWVAAFLFGVVFFLLAGAGTAVAVIVAWRVAGDWTPGKAVLVRALRSAAVVHA